MNELSKSMSPARRILAFMSRAINILVIVFIALVLLVVDNTILHVKLRVCLLHLKRFESVEVIPVVYGLPTYEMIQAAKRGRILLGGCFLGPVTGVCPYCKWPARFRGTGPARHTSHEPKIIHGGSATIFSGSQ